MILRPETAMYAYIDTSPRVLPSLLPVSLCEFELRFESLFQRGRALTFPCDEKGSVVLDALSDRARCNYLYARAVVGREYATPAVVRGG